MSEYLDLDSSSFTTKTRFKFTIDEAVPIADLIDSLKGFEKLIKASTPLVEKSLNGVKIIRTDVLVEEITEGSFVYDFIVKHVISEKHLHEAKELAMSVLVEKPVVKTAVTMGVGAMIYATANSFITNNNETDEPQPKIEAYNSVIIQTAGDINISKDDMNEFIDKVSNDKTVAKNVIKTLKPTQITPNAELISDDFPMLNVSHEIIKDIPENIDHLTPQKRETVHDNIDVYIYASDQDKAESGWGGIVPELFDKRVKFKLAEGVNPFDLHGKRKITATITLHEKYSPQSNDYIPEFVAIDSIN